MAKRKPKSDPEPDSESSRNDRRPSDHRPGPKPKVSKPATEIESVSFAIEDLDEAMDQKFEPVADLVHVDEVDDKTDLSSDYLLPWERRPNEFDYTWDAFRHYRNLGPRRSHRATSIYLRNDTAHWSDGNFGIKPSNSNPESDHYRVRDLAANNDWSERVALFDEDQEQQYQLARSQAIREMAERHESTIEKAIVALMAPVDALQIAMEEDPDFISVLSKQNKNKLVDLASRVMKTIPNLMAAERLSRGMPTQIISGTVDHQVNHVVERDQIGEILEVLGRAGVLNVAGSDIGAGEIVDAEVVEVHSVSAEGDN